MDVFAFLPIRSFGFKFIIQADFVLPASRQDLNQDSFWNRWLCDQIPRLFADSIGLFRESRQLLFGGQAEQFDELMAYLEFVPFEEEVVGSLFRQIPEKILSLLRNTELLPIVADDNDGGTSPNSGVVWKKPAECAIISDQRVRQLLTSHLLHEHFGCYYLHESLAAVCSRRSHMVELFSRLGVRFLSLADLFDILKASIIFQRPAASRLSIAGGSLLNTARFLVLIEHCLGSYSSKQADAFLKQLRQLKFIPIVNEPEQLTSLNDGKYLFFPCKTSALFSSAVDDASPLSAAKYIKPIQSDLCQIDIGRLMCLGDKCQNDQVVSLLRRLGIRELNEEDLIEKHIIPRLNKLDQERLIGYLVFLMAYWQRSRHSTQLNLIRSLIPIKTSHGFLLPFSRKFYFSTDYGNTYDLRSLLGRYDWCLLDPVYLSRTLDDPIYKMDDWRRFFTEYFGIRDIFEPELINRKVG